MNQLRGHAVHHGRVPRVHLDAEAMHAGKPQTCSAGGTWADDQATVCPFVCDAATGKCAGECVPGSDACTGEFEPSTAEQPAFMAPRWRA